MAVDSGTPLSRVTPATGANAVRPADRREGRRDRSQPEAEEQRDIVDLSDAGEETAQPDELSPEEEGEKSDAEPKLDIRA